MRWLLLLLTPVFALSGLLVNTSESGDVYEVSLLLDRADGGLSGYIMNITAKGCEVTAVDFPQWAALKDWNNNVAKAVDLKDDVRPGATNVPLATLRVRALNREAALEISVRIDDDSGKITFEKISIPIKAETTATSTATTPQPTTQPTTPTTPSTSRTTTETWEPPPLVIRTTPSPTSPTIHTPTAPRSQIDMWQVVLWVVVGVAFFSLAYLLTKYILSR